MAFVARPGRIDLCIPVVLDVEGERITVETRNIGLGGAFVATLAPLFVGQRLPLRISLPELGRKRVTEAQDAGGRTAMVKRIPWLSLA